MKKILYFYPHKFAQLTDGIHTRIVTLLEYFQDRGILVDMLCFEDTTLATSYVEEKKLVAGIYYAKKKVFPEIKPPAFLVRKARGALNRLFPKPQQRSGIQDLMSESLVDKVVELNDANKYDAVLITYAYWADIVNHLPANSTPIKKIIDTTDFLTLQQFYYNESLPTHQIGDMFGSEISRMKWFDAIIHISYDELLLFSNFIPSVKHLFVPQFFSNRFAAVKTDAQYDILYVGSDNRYNIEGIQWFLDHVYPLLSMKIRIAVAGKICNEIAMQTENIHLLGFVNDTEKLYRTSRLAICPLRKGSGMKIKVIESLSYGVPVVSTLKGVDGFPSRYPPGGVLVEDTPAAFAKAIDRLVNDDLFYDQQCMQAKKLFNDQFSFEANFNKLDEIFGSTDKTTGN